VLYVFGVRAPAERLYSSHHLHHFTPKSLRATLEQSGLKVVAVRNHNSPLAAVDIPPTGVLGNLFFKLGLIGLSILGQISGKTYLQTMIARKISF
jgi:hypothetical protein